MQNKFIIKVTNATIHAYVGIYDVEKLNKQPILVDIAIEWPANKFENENLDTTINYETIWKMVITLFEQKWLLLESAAMQLANNIKIVYGTDLSISITMMKTNSVIENFNGSVGINYNCS
jgi:FolB domain-containing protein